MKINRLKNLFLVVSIFIFGNIIVVAQAAQMSPEQTELAKYITDNYTKREAMIPMRDGVKLFTSIYEPKDKSQKYPILLDRTPYTVAPYGADKFKTQLGTKRFVRQRRLHFRLSGRARTLDVGRRICGRATGNRHARNEGN